MFLFGLGSALVALGALILWVETRPLNGAGQPTPARLEVLAAGVIAIGVGCGVARGGV